MVSKVYKFGALAASGLFLASSGALATPITFDFSLETTGYSLTKSFGPESGVSVTVGANTVAADGSAVTPVAGSGVGVGQWYGFGLGLRNSPTDNSHTVDGYGLNDLLTLAFTESVKMVSATFSYAGVVEGGQDDFAFFHDDDGNSSVAGDMVWLSEDIPGTGTGTFVFAGDFTGELFGFAAIYDAVVGSRRHRHTIFDSFKLKSVVVDYTPTPVPLPAALPLFASVLAAGGMGAAWRRRKAAPAG